MARRALSEAEIEEFRARAVEAALALYREQGIAGISMRSLADALGVSAMTPYRYFDNQEHVLSLVRTHAFEQLTILLERADVGATPRARIESIGRAYLRFAAEDGSAYRLMFDLSPPTESREALTAASKASFGPLVAAVTSAIATGSLRGDPLTVSHVIWAGLHGLASLGLANKLNFGRSADELTTALFEQLLG